LDLSVSTASQVTASDVMIHGKNGNWKKGNGKIAAKTGLPVSQFSVAIFSF